MSRPSSPEAPVTHEGEVFTHVACVLDFAGWRDHPSIWADIFVAPDGRRVIKTGGHWLPYGTQPPRIIEHADARFDAFIDACDADDPIGFSRIHWPAPG